jgi:hypothetical protein
MKREALLAAARELKQPPPEAIQEFTQKREQLASMGNQLMSERPDLERLVGQGNQLMAENNNRNFARFMESLFHQYQPEVLVETVLWVFRTYRAHGFTLAYWPANLDSWVNILEKELSAASFKAIYPFYNWLITNIPVFAKLTDSEIPQEAPNN